MKISAVSFAAKDGWERKECPVCGVIFWYSGCRTVKYCGASCRQSAYRDRKYHNRLAERQRRWHIAGAIQFDP
jgi:hypothetical protein